MKILLINPKTLFPGKIPSFPLGLLQVAALPYKNNHEIEILDCNISSISSIKKKIKISDPDVVGFTTKTGKSLKSVIELSRFTRENSNAKIIWGGVHASLLPLQTIRENYIDIVDVGEGDFSFNQILDNLNHPEKVRGILFKKNEKIIQTPSKKLIIDLDSISHIPWELISIRKYAFKWIGGVKTVPISTSRGCPYRCTYCYNSVFHKQIWRPFSLSWIKKNIENLLSEFDIGGIKCDYEDNFIGTDFRRVIKLAEVFKGYGFKWSCQVRPDQVNRQILKKFKNSGCEYILMGVESGSQKTLNFVKKGIRVEKIRNIFDIIDQLKIRIAASFILDLPTEREEDLRKTIKLAESFNGILTAGFYQPYPGTELYDYVIKNKIFYPQENVEEWSNSDFSSIHGFSNIPKSKLKKIYFYMNYYLNIRNLIKNKDWDMLNLLTKGTFKSFLGND